VINVKIVAFNCSPRMRKSNTDRILGPLLEGASNAGAEVDTIYVSEYDISPCRGCFSCWFKTNGVCVQEDDLITVAMKMADANIIILATPLHYFGMSVATKNLWLRLGIPSILPFFVKAGGRLAHPMRYPGFNIKVVLVANALLWGDGVFDYLVDSLNDSFTRTVDEDGNAVMKMVGKILVEAGEMLGWDEVQGDLGPFNEQLRKAGEELARDGRLSQVTEDKLNVPFWSYLGMDSEQAFEFANEHFKRTIEEGGHHEG
jgi:hypothetical protein